MMSDDPSTIPFRFGFDLDAVIDQAFSQLIHEPWGCASPSWQPAIDVFETDDAYQILIEIPGVSPEAVEIYTEGSCLLISGDRGTVRVTQFGRAVRLERTSGSFSRMLPLEHPVDIQQMERRAEQGILYVRLPKNRPSSPQLKTLKPTVSPRIEQSEK